MDNNLQESLFDKELYKLGKKMLKIFGISGIIYRLKSIYLIVMPREEYVSLVCGVKLFFKLFGIWIFVFCFQYLLGENSAYNIAITVSVLWFLSTGIINKVYSDKQHMLLNMFDNYLSQVRHYFHINGSIEDAIYDSMDNCEGMLKLHISQIYDLIVSKDSDIIEKYKDIAPNKYFLTFMGLCQTVMIYGDTLHNEKSVFLENIGYLRDEIRIFMLKEKRVEHAFSGLSVMTILPIFTLPFIERWGVSNLPELRGYYDGVYGMIVSIVIAILSIIAFSLITFLKNSYRYTSKNHDFLDKLLGRLSVYNLVEFIIEKYPLRSKKLKKLLAKSGESINIYEFIAKELLVFIAVFLICIFMFIYMVYIQILSTGEGNFKLYYVLLAGIIAFLASKGPILIIRIKRLLMEMNYEDEVMQFHSIIIMLVYIKRISSEIILEWLEDFSDIFKKSLSECNARYSMNEAEALCILKNEESYLPFLRIVENLEDCDRVGAERAFEEICTQRQYFIEKRKQDNEINISNKGTIGKVVGYIPLLVTVFAYLIFPFVAESINQLLTYVNEINNL